MLFFGLGGVILVTRRFRRKTLSFIEAELGEKMKKSAVLVLMVLLVFGTVSGAYADIFNAVDGGWSITVDSARQIRDGEGSPTDGLVNWKDPFGYDYVYQDTWFGRGGDAASEGPLSSLTFLSGSNSAPNQILLNFKDNGQLSLDLSYELSGSGLSSSVLEKGILTNGGTDPLTLSIFKYADYDLTYGHSAHNDDFAFGNALGITQHDAFSIVSMTPTSSIPNAFQISVVGCPGSIISSLNDGNVTNLNNTGSPYGPGDASFAFQWNFTLAPGQAYTIENMKTLTTTPEPISCALFLVGGGALVLARKKKMKLC